MSTAHAWLYPVETIGDGAGVVVLVGMDETLGGDDGMVVGMDETLRAEGR